MVVRNLVLIKPRFRGKKIILPPPVGATSESAPALYTNHGTPVNGTTLAGEAQPASVLIDTNGKKVYINTNTKASPTWTLIGSQS